MLAGEGNCRRRVGMESGAGGQVGAVSRLEVAIVFTINGDSFIFMGGFFTRRKTARVQ